MATTSTAPTPTPHNLTHTPTEPVIARTISGCKPGVLDPSQPARVLRKPSHKLSFASFDPLTGTAFVEIPDLRKLSLNEELCRPKRIVLETNDAGDNFWRFVPNARREEGCLDEGKWPRVIIICDEFVDCSLEQWEIYKLDPEYECLVRAPPNRTVISRAQPAPTQQPTAAPSSQPPPRTTTPLTLKRTRSSEIISSTSSISHKRQRTHDPVAPLAPPEVINIKDEGYDTEEVEHMIIDETPTPQQSSPHRTRSTATPHRGPRAQFLREQIAKDRKELRERLTKAAEKHKSTGLRAEKDENQKDLHENRPMMNGDHVANGQSKTASPEPVGKRKASTAFDSSTSTLDQTDASATSRPSLKRLRRTPTPTTNSWLNGKRAMREKEVKRKAVHEYVSRVAREAYSVHTQEQEHLHASDQPHEESDLNGTHYAPKSPSVPAPDGPHANHDASEEELNEEAIRRVSIAASIAKLAELERDRPMWEEAARQRQAAEAAEEAAREERRRQRAAAAQAEAEKRAQEEREEQEARERAEAAEREAAARRQRERRHRAARLSSGPWTTLRALERYRTLCEAFDTTRFSELDPLTFADVPWPVLLPPPAVTLEDVGWESVERFFAMVRPHMRAQDYKTLVEKSHKRFHPDRWRSRGLLKSVQDETERNCLEVTANTVAQAITPLWSDLRG